MTSAQFSQQRPVSHRRRNLLAILIAFAAVSLLYFNFEATPAGGNFEEEVNLDKVTAEVSVPVAGGNNRSDAQGENGSAAANTLRGKTALLMHLMLLERGIRRMQQVSDYTATFYKREVVDGTLADPQVMQLKLRHEPFSVYMKWLVGDKGRELLYVEGQNNGEMLVRLGGVKKLIPTLKLDPAGSQAMKEARYPVTQIGLLKLAEKVLEYRKRDMRLKPLPQCRMFENQLLNDRKCFCFVVEYQNARQCRQYRKSVIFIDQEWLVPVCVQNFGWPSRDSGKTGAALDKETLLEDYRYSNIRMEQKLADRDFDRSNRSYRLR